MRSEAVWTIHINAKQHRENVEYAKKLKERTNSFSTVPKRPISPVEEENSSKKLKGILKNSKTNVQNETEKEHGEIPDDFFDDNKNRNVINVKLGFAKKNEEKMEVDDSVQDETLPEGFFDDPKLDAKVFYF